MHLLRSINLLLTNLLKRWSLLLKSNLLGLVQEMMILARNLYGLVLKAKKMMLRKEKFPNLSYGVQKRSMRKQLRKDGVGMMCQLVEVVVVAENVVEETM